MTADTTGVRDRHTGRDAVSQSLATELTAPGITETTTITAACQNSC